MNKKLLLLPAFVMPILLMMAPASAIWFNTSEQHKGLEQVNATSVLNGTLLTNQPYIVNGSAGVFSLTNTCNPTRFIWGLANISSSNTTQQYLYYNSCSDFQLINGTEDTRVPFELENGSVSYQQASVWQPQNHTVVFHFGEGRGTNVNDSTGWANTGTMNSSGIVWNTTSSLFGNFLSNDGTGVNYVSVKDSASLLKGGTFTLSIWFRPEKSGSFQAFVEKGINDNSNDEVMVRMTNTGEVACLIGSPDTSIDSSSVISLNVWHHLVCTYDGTKGRLWVDGIFQKASNAGPITINTQDFKVGGGGGSGQTGWQGDVDEFRLSTQNFTDDQIAQLYYDGARLMSRITQISTLPPSYYSSNISLNTPVFETNWTVAGITVNVSDPTTKNVSAYFFWNGTNQSFSTYFNDTHGNFTFTNNLTIPLLLGINNTAVPSYWNFTITFNNGTSVNDNVTNVSQNLLYAYNGITLGNVAGNYLEGSNISFTASTTNHLSIASLDSIFYLWNSSSDMQKSGTMTTYGNFANWFLLPPPNGLSGIEYINSSLNVSYGGLWTLRNVTSSPITVGRIVISGCNATYSQPTMIEYNFVEDNQTAFSNSLGNVTIGATFDAYTAGQTRSYPVNLTGNSTLYTICLYPAWASFQTNATILYSAPGYSTRSYYLFNATVDNTTRSFNLYLLPTGESSLTTFTVRDSSSNLLSNAYVYIQRYYPETNTYQTVEIVKTDANGLAPSYINLYTVFYKFLVLYGGVTRIDSVAALQSNANIQFIVDTGGGGVQYYTISGLSKSCAFNNQTRYLSCQFVDNSGFLTQGCLDVSTVTPLRTTLVNTSCLSSASGTLAFFIPADNTTHTYQFYGRYSLSPSSLTTWISDTISGPLSQPYGLEGVFIAFFLFLTAVGIGLKDPRVAIIMSVLVLVIGFALGLLAIGVAALVSLIAVAVIIIWRSRTQ